MYRKLAISLVLMTLAAGYGEAALSARDEPVPEKGLLLSVPSLSESSYSSTIGMVRSQGVFEETFENGKNAWSITGSAAIGIPQGGPRRGYNSSACAATNLAGSYGNETDDRLMSPLIRLPELTPGSQLTLSFREWFELESGWDIGRVEVSSDGGSTWRVLGARSGQSGWREMSVDLSAYAGQSVILAFHFTSDTSDTYAGWYIDDVRITRMEPQQLGASLVNLNPQNFPFIYMNVSVTRDGDPLPTLDQSNFSVYENKVGASPVLQTDNFKVTPPDQGGGSRLADVIFLMDNSGSMEEEINAISNNVINFVNGLTASGVDFRLGLCRFGAYEENGYPIIEDGGQLTSDANYFKNSVWTRNVTDGGFEPGWDALYRSATSFSFRPGSQKVFILITDETPTGDNNIGQYSKSQAISTLQSNSVTTFALVNTADPYAQTDYCEITQATNGSCFDIYSPFDEILDYITEQVSGTYLVQYKSSQPDADGEERQVRVHVTEGGETVVVEGSYIPGAAPKIQRTAATIALHYQNWDEETPFTIEAEIKDEADPPVESATLFYRTTGETVYSAAGMSEYSEDIYRGTIPGTAVHNPGVEYYISATDGVSTSSDPSVDPTSYPYVIGILPNEAPRISHAPVGNLVLDEAITITATIEDTTNRLDVTQLSYRIRGDLLYASVDMTELGGNQFEGVIPGTYATEDGVEYYLYAEDDFGVGTYSGTPDNPYFIEAESQFGPYITLKLAIIANILGINRPFLGTSSPFAVAAEYRARTFVNGISAKYNDKEADARELEAVARLYLSERVANQAYVDGVAISSWGAKGLKAITFSYVCSAVFKRVVPAAEWLAKQSPRFGGPLLRTINRVIDKVDRTIYRLVLAYQNSFQIPAGQLTLDQWATAQQASQTAISKAAGRITRSTSSYMDKKVFDAGVFETFDRIIQDYVFLNPLDALTHGSQNTAVFYAENQYFPFDAFEAANSDATETLSDLASADALVNNAGLFAESTRQTAVFITLAGALGLVVAGIAGALFSGGASLIAALAGTAAVLTTYGSIVSSYAAISEAAIVGSHMLGAMPYLYVNPAVEEAFGPWSQLLTEGDGPPVRFAKAHISQSPRGERRIRPDHSEQVTDYYQRLRDMIAAGDTTWATTGVDSLNYYESLAIQDEDLAIADFMAGSDSARVVIDGYGTIVDRFLRQASARDMYSASIDICGLVYSTGVADTSMVNAALAALDSTMSNFTRLVTTKDAVYDSLETHGIPTPTAVGIGSINSEIIGTDPGRATLEVEVINYGPDASELVHVYPLMSDEGAEVLGDSLFLVTLAGGDTAFVEFEVTSTDSFIDGTMMLSADPVAAYYYTLPGKGFSVELSSATPPTESSLNSESVYAYPNPFDPADGDVRFRFRLAQAGDVTIKIYDVSNVLVKTVVSRVPMAADAELEESWNGRNEDGTVVANGVYFYTIESSTGERAVGKVAVLR